ncbi:MAG: DUF3243 domain-containing protein [Bacillota bacterium]|nr:DUF3243 domain-containing protein [Bacillota bacterium]
MELETTWHKWKHFLGTMAKTAERIGLSDRTVEDASYHLGEFIARHFDPGNREQRLIKELWDEGDKEERRVLASLITRVAEKSIQDDNDRH